MNLTSIAFDREAPTSARTVASYRNDSLRAAQQRKAWRLRLIRASSRFSLSRILNRLTLANSSVSLLLAFSLFASLHTVYA